MKNLPVLLGKSRGRSGSLVESRVTFWPGRPVGSVGFGTSLDCHLVPVHAERLLTVRAPRYDRVAGTHRSARGKDSER